MGLNTILLAGVLLPQGGHSSEGSVRVLDPPRWTVEATFDYSIPPRGLVPAASFDRLLEEAWVLEVPWAAVQATRGPHLRIDVQASDDHEHMEMTLWPSGRGPLDEPVRLDWNEEDGIGIELRCLDPESEHERTTRFGPGPVVKILQETPRADFALPAPHALASGWKLQWVVVERAADRFEIFPAALPESFADMPVNELIQELEAHAPCPPVPEPLPRYRLAEITRDLVEGRASQGRRLLQDLAAEFPHRVELVVRRALVEVEEGRVKAARELLLPWVTRSPPLPTATRLLRWLSETPEAALVPEGASLARRVDAVEALRCQSVDPDRLEVLHRVAVECVTAMQRLHLGKHPESCILLVSAGAGTLEGETEGFVQVGEVGQDLDSLACARGLLYQRIGERADAPWGRALAAYVTLLAGAGPDPVRHLRDAIPAVTTPDHSQLLWSWLEQPSRLVESLASPEQQSLGMAALALLVQRVLDQEGPAALASRITGGGDSFAGIPSSLPDLIASPEPGSVRLEHLGHACFRFTSSDGRRLLLDPYSSLWPGARLPWVWADEVAITHGHSDHDAIEAVRGAPRRIPFITEPEVPAVQAHRTGLIQIRALRSLHDTRYPVPWHHVLSVMVEGMHIVHLGDIDAPLPEELISRLGPVDVLLAPIDDRSHILSAAQLADIEARTRPRILVPMHYWMAGVSTEIDSLGGIDGWLADRASVRRLPSDGAILRAADLPRDSETWVFALEPWPAGRLEPR